MRFIRFLFRDPVREILFLLEQGLLKMSQLQDAVSALQSSEADNAAKLDSVISYVKSIPDTVAAAVANALSQANVDEAQAATLIDAARTAEAAKVDEALSAVNANQAPPATDPSPPVAA